MKDFNARKTKYVHELFEFVRTNRVEREDSIPNYATLLVNWLKDLHWKKNALTEFLLDSNTCIFLYVDI